MRQVVLDTETTGLEPRLGHRIIEIGCVELINRRLTGNSYHQYINPEREIDAGAMAVHGITNEYLLDKPVFADIAGEFMDFIKDAELVIHNAPFDVGFMDHEFNLLGSGWGKTADVSTVLDTLVMARKMFPGQKNNLDALCKRYYIDNSKRDLHGALLDAEILAEVYLAMTGGQVSLLLGEGAVETQSEGDASEEVVNIVKLENESLKVVYANDAELILHKEKLTSIDKKSGGNCIWLHN